MATKADEKHDLERGERIEDLMRLQGWSPSGLSRAIHVDRSQIYKWLEGGPISSDNVGKLAVALGTTRRYIISGEAPKWADDARVLERLELLETRVIGALNALRADLKPIAGDGEVAKRSRQVRRQAARPDRKQQRRKKAGGE